MSVGIILFSTMKNKTLKFYYNIPIYNTRQETNSTCFEVLSDINCMGNYVVNNMDVFN